MERRLPQKMFATGDERCPVKLLRGPYITSTTKLEALWPTPVKKPKSVHTCPALPLTVHWESGTSLFPVTKGLATVPPVHPFIGP